MPVCIHRGTLDIPCPERCIYEDGVVEDTCQNTPRKLAWAGAQNVWTVAHNGS